MHSQHGSVLALAAPAVAAATGGLSASTVVLAVGLAVVTGAILLAFAGRRRRRLDRRKSGVLQA